MANLKEPPSNRIAARIAKPDSISTSTRTTSRMETQKPSDNPDKLPNKGLKLQASTTNSQINYNWSWAYRLRREERADPLAKAATLIPTSAIYKLCHAWASSQKSRMQMEPETQQRQ